MSESDEYGNEESEMSDDDSVTTPVGVVDQVARVIKSLWPEFQAKHSQRILAQTNKLKDALLQPGRRPEIDYGPMPERLTFGRASTPATATHATATHLMPEMEIKNHVFQPPPPGPEFNLEGDHDQLRFGITKQSHNSSGECDDLATQKVQSNVGVPPEHLNFSAVTSSMDMDTDEVIEPVPRKVELNVGVPPERLNFPTVTPMDTEEADRINRLNKLKDALWQPGRRPEIDYGSMPERLTFGRASTPEPKDELFKQPQPRSGFSFEVAPLVNGTAKQESHASREVFVFGGSASRKAGPNVGVPQERLQFPAVAPSTIRKTRTQICGSSGSRAPVSVPVIMMPRQEPLPHMSLYLQTCQNLLAPDNLMLDHVPFQAISDPGTLERHVQGFFRCHTHIHGVTRTFDYDHLDDRQLSTELYPEFILEVWRALIPMNLDGVYAIRPFKGKLPAQQPPPIIFDAMAIVFPHHGTVEEHTKSYHWWLLRFKIVDPPQPFPDIDGPNATSMSAEKALQAYLLLYCARCVAERPSYQGRKLKAGDVEESEHPCSKDCYKHDCAGARVLLAMEFAENKGPKVVKAMGKKGTRVTTQNDVDENATRVNGAMISRLYGKYLPKRGDKELTPAQQTLARMLFQVFKENVCVIAKNILKEPRPTCRQVFLFAMSELRQNKPLHEPNLTYENQLPCPGREAKRTAIMARLRKQYEERVANGTQWIAPHYIPCDHLGVCGEDGVISNCAATDQFCEKWCTCSSECPYRFPGCKCTGDCTKGNCPCLAAGRECDPEICLKCDFPELELRKGKQTQCLNNQIQSRTQHPVHVAHSSVVGAGWGLFSEDFIPAGDMVLEYCGERITHEEAERRGKLYDFEKRSFLFNLDEDYVIDATVKGNDARFANHAEKANLRAELKMVSGDRHIALVATRDIEPDEELFFDYRYGPTEKLKFVHAKPGRPRDKNAGRRMRGRAVAAGRPGPSSGRDESGWETESDYSEEMT